MNPQLPHDESVPIPIPVPPQIDGTLPIGPPTSGYAIASMVLAVVPLCAPTSIVGLILGIKALRQIRKSGGRLGGRGLAIAGIVISGVMLFFGLAVLAGMLLPALAKAKSRAGRVQLDQCETQLEEIGGVLHEYARSHGDAYPESLSVIYTQLKGPKILLCPADSAHRPARSWESLGEQNLSFTYDGKGRSITNESDSILTCPIHDSYLTADGIVHPGTVPRSRRR